MAVPPLPLSSPVGTINPSSGVSPFPTGTVTSDSSTCSLNGRGHDTAIEVGPFQKDGVSTGDSSSGVSTNE